VRRLIQIALVALGIRAFLRWRKRRKAEAVAPAPAAQDPADELRQKLAENRTEGPAEEPPAAPDATVEDRRAEVHEQARATIDDMKSSDEG
jgi:predicted lipid-binding transport protein (Tim44 family)